MFLDIHGSFKYIQEFRSGMDQTTINSDILLPVILLINPFFGRALQAKVGFDNEDKTRARQNMPLRVA